MHDKTSHKFQLLVDIEEELVKAKALSKERLKGGTKHRYFLHKKYDSYAGQGLMVKMN